MKRAKRDQIDILCPDTMPATICDLSASLTPIGIRSEKRTRLIPAIQPDLRLDLNSRRRDCAAGLRRSLGAARADGTQFRGDAKRLA